MQLEVFANPLIHARTAYPYVVVLQSDVTALGRERIVAFLAPHTQVGNVIGRLMPIVTLDKRSFVVLMPSITNVTAEELRDPVGNLQAFRQSIIDAIDATFLGG